MSTSAAASRIFTLLTLGMFVCAAAYGQDSDLSAGGLAARLSAQREQGSAYIRLKIDTRKGGSASEVLQVQIKERRTPERADVIYQVLWPKERQGEGVLLQQTRGRNPGGSYLGPGGRLSQLNASEMDGPLLGSSLALADAIENFFAWKNQTIAGKEAAGGVEAVILESSPGAGDSSIYGSVRSWIDPARLVPLRIEKYSKAGTLLRRFEADRVVRDGGGYIPGGLTVTDVSNGTVTQLSGSRIDRSVNYSDSDFSAQGLARVTQP